MAHGRKPRNQQRPKHAARRGGRRADPARVQVRGPRGRRSARTVREYIGIEREDTRV